MFFSGIIPLPSKFKMKNFIFSLWYRYKDWEYERKCIKHLGMKPTKIYLSQEDFDALVERLELPSEATMESIKRLVNRKAPWEEENG